MCKFCSWSEELPKTFFLSFNFHWIDLFPFKKVKQMNSITRQFKKKSFFSIFFFILKILNTFGISEKGKEKNVAYLRDFFQIP